VTNLDVAETLLSPEPIEEPLEPLDASTTTRVEDRVLLASRA
jgi:hypothetical protein